MGAQSSKVGDVRIIRPSDDAFGNELMREVVTDSNEPAKNCERISISSGSSEVACTTAQRLFVIHSSKQNARRTPKEARHEKSQTENRGCSTSQRKIRNQSDVHNSEPGRIVLGDVTTERNVVGGCSPKYRRKKNAVSPAMPATSIMSETERDAVEPFVKDDATALFAAAKSGTIETISWLIDTGANVNARTPPHGATPLYAAAQHNRPDVVRLLLKRGANPNIKRKDDGGTPLHAASEQGLTDIVAELLARGSFVNAKNVWNQTPLLAAVENAVGGRHITCIRTLLGAGADPTIADDHGKFPLTVSAAMGHMKAVRAITKHGANINQVDNESCSALFLACCFARKEIVRYLVTEGAHVNLASVSGATPLFMAAQSGSYESCEILLGSPHIQKDKTNKDGRTAIHAACRAHQSAIVHLLVHSGCNPSIEGKWGTPLKEMELYGGIEPIRKILSSGEN